MIIMENYDRVIKEDSRTVYYLKGFKHRTDGPAIEYFNGDKYWYQNGFIHREDGPAIEFVNGNKCWYINGRRINCSSMEEFIKITVHRKKLEIAKSFL